MRLPAMNAHHALGAAPSAGPAAKRVQGLSLQSGWLDSAWGFTKCITKCGLSGSVSCLKCGTDLACWAECAGPKAVQCLADCI